VIVTYKPEGQSDPKTWEVDLGNMRSSEMEGIEGRTKMNFGTDYKQALYARNTSARRALLWTLLRRDNPFLLYKDVDFADREVECELDKKEWADLRDSVVKAGRTIDPEELQERLSAIDRAIEDAPEAPGKSLTPSPTSEPNTD
jgi:hypothetical protein